jgi:hypothetical protein
MLLPGDIALLTKLSRNGLRVKKANCSSNCDVGACLDDVRVWRLGKPSPSLKLEESQKGSRDSKFMLLRHEFAGVNPARLHHRLLLDVLFENDVQPSNPLQVEASIEEREACLNKEGL